MIYEQLGADPLSGETVTGKPSETGTVVLYGNEPQPDPAELEAAFHLQDDAEFPWIDLVRLCSQGDGNRVAALQEFLRVRAQHPGERRPGPRRAWSRNEGRDQVIWEGLCQGRPRSEICKLLDQRLIPTTLSMQKHGINTWMSAWEDPEFRPNVQTLFTKRRPKAVKS